MNTSTLKIGDIIVTSEGSKCRVMDVREEIFARSSYHSFITFQEYISYEDATHRGWKVLIEGKMPMTKEEVEGLLNIKITN